MLGSVELRSFVKVMFRVQVVAVRYVRMMPGFFMMTGLVVFGSLFMMRCSVPMMFGR